MKRSEGPGRDNGASDEKRTSYLGGFEALGKDPCWLAGVFTFRSHIVGFASRAVAGMGCVQGIEPQRPRCHGFNRRPIETDQL